MNVDRLLAVREMVLRYPENHDMYTWSTGTLMADKHAAPACGTTGCIAGWALALRDGAFNQESYLSLDAELTKENLASIIEDAEIALDIDSGSSSLLFVPFFWPDNLGIKYEEAPTPSAKAQVTAERIDLFILSNGTK